MLVDWDFIRELEGFSLKGYTPLDKEGRVIGKSGVTVGVGFDIGQWTTDSLRLLNLPEELYLKLVQYVGMKGSVARDFLKVRPLTLTPQEANLLNEAVKTTKLKELEDRYNKAASGKVKFSDLTLGQRTVLASVAFQYGTNLSRRTPRFWNFAVTQQWGRLEQELRNFGDAFPTRRNREADYLSRRG